MIVDRSYAKMAVGDTLVADSIIPFDRVVIQRADLPGDLVRLVTRSSSGGRTLEQQQATARHRVVPAATPGVAPPEEEPAELEEVCSRCSASYPAGEPMVSFDGSDYCSYRCVFEELTDLDEPGDHDSYVTRVRRHEAHVARVIARGGG